MFKLHAVLAAAVVVLAAATAAAQTAPRPATAPVDDRQLNVRQSADYDRLIGSNEAFRQKRIRDECDPISSPDLKQACINSFGPAAPARPAR